MGIGKVGEWWWCMHVQLFPQPNAQSFRIFFLVEKKNVWYLSKAYMKIFWIECIREMICASDTLNVFILCLIFQWIPNAWRKRTSCNNKRLRIECIHGVCGSHDIFDKSDSFQCAHPVDQSWTLILMIFLFPFNLDAWFSYNSIQKHAN